MNTNTEDTPLIDTSAKVKTMLVTLNIQYKCKKMQKNKNSRASCTKVAELATPASLDGKLAGLKARQEGNTVGRQRSTHIKYKAYEIKRSKNGGERRLGEL